MFLVFLLSGIFEGTLCFTDGVTFSYLSISHNETLSTGKKDFLKVSGSLWLDSAETVLVNYA